MLRWYMFLAYYAIMSLISWAYASYQIGKHRGNRHDGFWSMDCKEIECEASGKIQAVFLFLWPLLVILYPATCWSDFWIRTGANSMMPPLNSHPTPAKKDDDSGEKRIGMCPKCDASLSSPSARRCVNGHDF